MLAHFLCYVLQCFVLIVLVSHSRLANLTDKGVFNALNASLSTLLKELFFEQTRPSDCLAPNKKLLSFNVSEAAVARAIYAALSWLQNAAHDKYFHVNACNHTHSAFL